MNDKINDEWCLGLWNIVQMKIEIMEYRIQNMNCRVLNTILLILLI